MAEPQKVLALGDWVITVSPNSLISISDQCTRAEAAGNKETPSRGALVGEVIRDRDGALTGVKVLDCIEIVPKSKACDDPEALLATMLELCQANYPERELVGYFEASPAADISKPKAFSWPISEKNPPRDAEVTSTFYPCLYLVWNTSGEASNNKMSVNLYNIQQNGKLGARMNWTIDQDRDAEMIALTDVLSEECNRTSLTKLQRYREGVEVLMTKAQMLLTYLEDVEQGKKAADPKILRGMKSLLSRLPLTGNSSEFEDQLLTNYAESQLFAYLGAMTESSIMVAHNSLATSSSQRKFGNSFGYHSNMRMF